MDIYVLHDGKEIGPLSPEKTWQLIQQGSILADDLAWSPGMGKWEPLSGLLPPAESLPPAPAPAPIEPVLAELATPKQRALLAFLHVGFTRSTTKQEAALLISDALENPAFAVRLAQWPNERLKLHGDLFVAELQARRDNRAHHYLTLAQSEGAAIFTGVTRSHAQSVITHLDLASPNWEANETTAAREHFFPALAEKFPQLVRPGAPDLGSSPKTTPDTAAPPAKEKVRRDEPRGSFPFGAILRGLFFGALLVGLAWFVMKVLEGNKSTTPVTAATTPAPATPVPAPEPTPTPEPVATPAPATPAPVPESTPSTPAPAPATPPPATPAPTAPAPLALTRPYAAQMTYGVVTLPAGTPLKLIAPEGVLLKVQYLNDVFLVPPSATNHGAAPPP